MLKKILMVGALTLCLTGCFAGIENEVNKKGGFFGTHNANYIIVNTTGNLILDVYKLKDTYISENTNTDGVNFKHPVTGSHISLQGDVKIIRNPTSQEWFKYQEYHYDEIFMSKLGVKNEL